MMDPVLDAAPCGYLLVDDEGAVLAANLTLARLLSRPRAALLGTHVDQLLSVPSRIFYQTHVFPTLKLQGRVHEIYVSLRDSDGVEVPVMLNAQRMPRDERFVSDWIVMPMRQRDLYENEILNARRMAEEASRAKEEFLATVSHELRSPLSGIMGWAQLLATGQLDEPMREKAVAAILRGTRLQARLVDDILDFGRISAGKLRLEVTPMDVAPLVLAAVDGVTPAADAKAIRIDVEAATGLGFISGDAERLQQVLWNLLNNAVKFTPAGGRVRVRVSRVDHAIEVQVSDNGTGLDAEQVTHVFERFWQAGKLAERPVGGLGLGLAISSHLVELHGGTLRAESAGRGCGATFTMSLPLRNREETAAPPLRELASASGTFALASPSVLDSLDILLVEDDDDSRELVRTILSDAGARVFCARGAQEAIGRFLEKRPDVVVSDIGMKGGDGYALIRRLREIEGVDGPHVPAIALTAHSQATDRMRALAAGFQIHIPKPVHPTELVVAIANLAMVKTGEG